MAANQQDFLGQGTNDLSQIGLPPQDPNAVAAMRQNVVRRDAQATANRNAPYNAQRSQQMQDFYGSWLNNPDNPIHSASIDLPYAGDIPGVGEILESGFEAAQGAPLNFLENEVGS